jgi:YD repeat-containing protein
LTPVTGVIGRHKDPTRASAGYYCDGAGRLTARDAHRADLRRLAKLVAAYPEQARKMVRRLPPARRP